MLREAVAQSNKTMGKKVCRKIASNIIHLHILCWMDMKMQYGVIVNTGWEKGNEIMQKMP